MSSDDKPDQSNRRRHGRYQANNEGGYGNPPVKSQFQPGGAGGPGRRRGSTSMAVALQRMLSGKVNVSLNGQSRALSMSEAIAARVQKEILTGNLKALEMGIALMAKHGPVNQPDVVSMFDISALSIEQKRAMRALLMTAEPADRREVFKVLRQSKAWHKHKKSS